METTTFTQKVRRTNKTLQITIPKRVVEFEGIIEGDLVTITIKKQAKKVK